jgi:hypothetical protein
MIGWCTRLLPGPTDHTRQAPLGVCMIIERYYPHVAGAEKQLQARIPCLTRRGISVAVATRREHGLAAQETVAGAPVYRLPASGSRIMASLRFTLKNSNVPVLSLPKAGAAKLMPRTLLGASQ